MREKWKWIRGYKGLYKISSSGAILSVKRVVRCKDGSERTIQPKILKFTLTAGYPSVKLSKKGKTKTLYVHRLLLEAFVGPCPPRKECCHKDDNKLNCSLFNLSWGSRKRNMKDSIRNGLRKQMYENPQKGEQRYNSKLTKKVVRKIHKVWNSSAFPNRGDKSKLLRKLSKRFGVSSYTISAVVRGINWGHVAS